MRAALARIAVFGGGQVALLVATALARSLPRTRIAVVKTPISRAALADLAHTSLPSLARLHRRIGMDELGMLRRAAATHRLATRYRNWRADGADWIMGYGATPDPALTGGFATQWRGASSIAPDDARASGAAAALAQAKRFAPPSDDACSPLADLDYALRFDPDDHLIRLNSLAKHLRVEMLAGEPVAVERGSDTDLVSAVVLADGRRAPGDLFVDCTGPEGPIALATGSTLAIDWSSELPVDRIHSSDAPPELSPMDEVIALNDGYLIESPGRDHTRRLFCRSSAMGDKPSGAWDSGVAIAPGRLADAWTANVIAIGDAAARFEPLGWCNLHLAIRQIELLLELLPARVIEPLERAEYNRRAGLMADRVRDFVALHHAAVGATPFRKHAALLHRSETLNRTISEHERRGYLPHFEEDSIPRDLWLQLLSGAGFSAGPNARVIAMDDDRREQIRRHDSDRVARTIAASRPYSAWLADALEQAQ